MRWYSTLWAPPWQFSHIYAFDLGDQPKFQITKAHIKKTKKIQPGQDFVREKTRILPWDQSSRSSLGDLPTCKISKTYIKRQRNVQTGHVLVSKNRNMTLMSKFKVIGPNPWYATNHLYLIYLQVHAKYQKPKLKDKKHNFVSEKQKFDLRIIGH